MCIRDRREIIEVDPAALRIVERHEIAPFRGGSLPVVRLGRLFGIAVDRVSGQREIVVRGMADAMIQADGVAGATDLGDGRVVLILNLPDLARHARARAAARTPDPGGR